MLDVELVPVGDGHLVDTLDGWADRAATLPAVYGAIVADFHATEARRFNAEGPGWAPLAPSTQADRRRRGYGPGHPILVRTDRLALSLTRAGVEGAVYRTEPDAMFIGTNVPYAHYHQDGGTTPGRPPQRRIVALSDLDRARWARIIGRYLAHGVAEAAG